MGEDVASGRPMITNGSQALSVNESRLEVTDQDVCKNMLESIIFGLCEGVAEIGNHLVKVQKVGEEEHF